MRSLASLTLAALPLASLFMRAQEASCDLSGYRAQPGLTAVNGSDGLTVAWKASRDRDLASDRRGHAHHSRAGDPAQRGGVDDACCRRAAGVPRRRRCSPDEQPADSTAHRPQYPDHRADRRRAQVGRLLGRTAGPQPAAGPSARNPPPAAGIANQPGLPRKAGEITRAAATYRADRCEVKTDGARLEITFPGLQLGPFAGRLQFTITAARSAHEASQRPINRRWPTSTTPADVNRCSLAAGVARSVEHRSYRFGRTGQRADAAEGENRLLIARGGPPDRGGLAAAQPFSARRSPPTSRYVWIATMGRARSPSARASRARRRQNANFALYSDPSTWRAQCRSSSMPAPPPPADARSALAYTRRSHEGPAT